MENKTIKTVLIIGAGHMGRQIGWQSAVNGFNVTMYDIGEKQLEDAMAGIRKLAELFVKNGVIEKRIVPETLKRIRCSTDVEDASENADMVSESLPEDPKLKGQVFAHFNEYCPQHAIFTTNTSTLLPSMFAEMTGRPEKFAAFHFHDIRVTNVVDIMPHPGTSPETVETIRVFADRIGVNPIVLKKENYGYIFNAMLMEWFKAAQTLAANDVAAPDEIDRAWMAVMQSNIGPFGLMDSIGLQTVWKVTDYWANIGDDKQRRANADFLKQYIDQGRFGAACGKGIYSYPNPVFARPDFISGKLST